MMNRFLAAALSFLVAFPAAALDIRTSPTPGAVPGVSDGKPLQNDTIAINRADGKLFIRDTDGSAFGADLPQIDGSGYLKWRGRPAIGRYQGGKFISQPDAVQIQGSGSTGDASAFVAKPTNIPAGRPLSDVANSVYALAPASDTPDTVRPFPLFTLAPVASEVITSAALWSRIQDRADEPNRVFAHVLTYETSTGGGRPVGDISAERVALYLGMRGLPGGGSIWAFNTQTHLQTGYTGPGAAGGEIDVTNSAQHRGDGFGQIPYTALNSTGISINTLSTYRNGQGIFIDGKLSDGSPAWNRGFVVYNGAINSNWGCAFCDYGGSYATLSSSGSHTLGLDFSNATFGLDAVGLPAGSGVNWLSGGVSKGRIVVNAEGKMTLIASSLSLEGVPFATSAAAGGASALPGTPALYIPITYAGAVRYIPAFNAP